jgi:hypothetical protein
MLAGQFSFPKGLFWLFDQLCGLIKAASSLSDDVDGRDFARP